MSPNYLKSISLLACLILVTPVFSQSDSLFLKNKDYLVGEIKSMDKGVLIIETPYSKDDFRIKWIETDKIITKTRFQIATSKGYRYYGDIIESEGGKLTIKQEDSDLSVLDFEEIVSLTKIEDDFLDRLSASIDLGYNMTKARNQKQLTIRSRVGYLTRKWSLSGSINILASGQDDTEPIGRLDANINYIYLVKNGLFTVVRLDVLSNTEQKLNLRTNTKLGVGKYVSRTNQLYWNFSAGASFNNESFEGDESQRKSAEAWVGSELNLFDIKDFSMLTNIYVYPSITENQRVRVDYKVDLKYDLPLDFYIKTGLTWNYDSQPTPGAPTTDYVWQTSFGWSW